MATDVNPGFASKKLTYHVSSSNFSGRINNTSDIDYTYGLTAEKTILNIPPEIDFTRLTAIEVSNVQVSGKRHFLIADAGYDFQCIVSDNVGMITNGGIIENFGTTSIGVTTAMFKEAPPEYIPTQINPNLYDFSPWKFANLLTVYLNKILNHMYTLDDGEKIVFQFRNGTFSILNQTKELYLYMVGAGYPYARGSHPFIVSRMYYLQDIDNPIQVPIFNNTPGYDFYDKQLSSLQVMMGLLEPMGDDSDQDTTSDTVLYEEAQIIIPPDVEFAGKAAVQFKNNGISEYKIIYRLVDEEIREAYHDIVNLSPVRGHFILDPNPTPTSSSYAYAYFDSWGQPTPTNLAGVALNLYLRLFLNLSAVAASMPAPQPVISPLVVRNKQIYLSIDYAVGYQYRLYIVAQCIPPSHGRVYTDFDLFQSIGWWNANGGKSSFVQCGIQHNPKTGGYPMVSSTFPADKVYFVRSLLLSSFLSQSRQILSSPSDLTVADTDDLLSVDDLRDRDLLFSSFIYKINLATVNVTNGYNFLDTRIETYAAKRGKSLSAVSTARLGNKVRIEFELIASNGIDHAYTSGVSFQLDITFVLR